MFAVFTYTMLSIATIICRFDEQIMGSHISSYNRREMYFSFDPPLAAQFYYFIGMDSVYCWLL